MLLYDVPRGEKITERVLPGKRGSGSPVSVSFGGRGGNLGVSGGVGGTSLAVKSPIDGTGREGKS